MNPAAGGREPPGRGWHPLGTFPAAIAVCAAAAACGDPDPFSPRAWRVERLRVRYHKPLRQGHAVVARARLIEAEPEHVRVEIETCDEATGTALMSGTAWLTRLAAQ